MVLINYEILVNGNVVGKGSATTLPVTGNFTGTAFLKTMEDIQREVRNDHPRNSNIVIYPTYIYVFEPEEQTLAVLLE